MLTFEQLQAAHRSATAQLDAAVADLSPDQFSLSTPCADWTVADLLAHQQGQNHAFALALEQGEAPVEAFAPQTWDSEHWRTASSAVVAAFASVEPERTVVLREVGESAIPAQMVLVMHLTDTVIHHWDLATALGVPFKPQDADAIEATWEILSQIPDDESRTESGSSFAPRVTVTDDDHWTQAIALSGRDPRWLRPEAG